MLPTRDDFAAVFRLAVPVVTVQVGLMFMGVVDTLMVGRVSSEALASVALGNSYVWGVICFMMGILLALDPIISQAVGAGEHESVARGVQRGIILSFLVSIIAGILMVPVGPVLALLQQPEEVVPAAEVYTHIVIPGVLPFMLFTVWRQTLQALHRLRPLVAAIILANVFNAVLNRVLIFGGWGVPAMGVAGAAWATTICRWLMFLLVAGLAWRAMRPYLWPIRREAIQLELLWRVVRLGLPIGGHMWLEFAAFAVVLLLMGRLGTSELAAHNIAIHLAALTFMVPVALGQSASVLVGNGIGAGFQQRARRTAMAAIIAVVGFECLTTILFLSSPRLLAELCTSDVVVISIAATLIPIAGVFQLFDGLQAVAAGTLRGAGDTHAPMYINLVGYWMFGVPVSVFLAFHLEGGAPGLWWGSAAGLCVVATLLLLRVRHRFSRDIERVNVEQHPPVPIPQPEETHTAA